MKESQNKFRRLAVFSAVVILLMLLSPVPGLTRTAMAQSGQTYVVVLDPGHGGYDSGASETYNGVEYNESDITLTIAKYCYQALKKQPNLKVYMTRTKDTFVGVSERPAIADARKADLLVSFHLNSAGDITYSASGCMVLLSKGTYRPYLAKKEEVLTDFVLKNLNAVGIPTSTSSDNGRYYRLSEGSSYPNGGTRDYFGIVAGSVERDFPGVIIEHCFLSNPTDVYRFLGSRAKLKRIGEADAKAIISYFASEAASPVYGRETTRQAGWIRVGGKYYYRAANGTILKKRWLRLNGKRYFLKPDGSRAERFCRIWGNYYYFRPEGYAATGRYRVNNAYYLFTGTGKMIAQGWYTTATGRHYYTYPIGHAKKGQLLTNGKYILDGKVYLFNALGLCTNFDTARRATASQRRTLETIV